MNYNIFGGIFIQVRSSKEALRLLKASGHYLYNGQTPLPSDGLTHGGGQQDGLTPGNGIGKETLTTQAHPEQPPLTQKRFAYISDTAVQNNVADIVERELFSAAKGTATQLMNCIREEEMKGNLTTQHLSSKTLYYELKKHFHIRYKYRNFVNARH